MKAFFRKLKKSAAFSAAFMCVAACALAPSAFGSAVSVSDNYLDGAAASGAYLIGANCGVGVDGAEVTFNVFDFPEPTAKEGLANYSSTVTTDYVLRNTSDSAATLTLAVPYGGASQYSTDGCPFYATCEQDENSVEASVRHYLASAYSAYDTLNAYISDSLYSDSFYSVDLPVTVMRLDCSTVKYPYVLCRLVFKSTVDKTVCRFIGDMEYHIGGASGAQQYAKTDDENYIYVLGDAEAFLPKLTILAPETTGDGNGSYTEGYEQVYDVEASLTTVKTTTLKELVLSFRGADSVVSETDWYNGVVRSLGGVFNCGGESNLSVRDESFYEARYFSINIGANESSSVSFTSPVYAGIDGDYSPYIYDYSYTCANYGAWNYFGSVKLTVNTSFYLYDGSVKKTENGFTAEYNAGDSISFRLSSSSSPTYRYTECNTSSGSSSVWDEILYTFVYLLFAFMLIFSFVSPIGVETFIAFACIKLIAIILGIIFLIVILKKHKKH